MKPRRMPMPGWSVFECSGEQRLGRYGLRGAASEPSRRSGDRWLYAGILLLGLGLWPSCFRGCRAELALYRQGVDRRTSFWGA